MHSVLLLLSRYAADFSASVLEGKMKDTFVFKSYGQFMKYASNIPTSLDPASHFVESATHQVTDPLVQKASYID